VRLASAGIAALASGFIIDAGVRYGLIPDDGGVRADTIGVSVLAKAPRHSNPGAVRLASLETDVGLDTASPEESSGSPAHTRSHASFAERFGFGGVSFGDRFNGDNALAYASADADEQESDLALPPPADAAAPLPKPARGPSSTLASLPPASKMPPATDALKGSSVPADLGGRTAIYDIAAHTVYLPDGRKLEAHSGRGSYLDDPRAVTIKGRGPTPPNIYQLSLRESLFHGVRALRLPPVNENKMHGRDGILAHTYMLGPKGASMGCVSFSNYPAFLNAYLEGKVDRLVVVDRLANPPSSKTASGGITDKLKALFSRS
jgi:type VI secretion system (T6SS) effector TldE1-like protein